MTPREQDEMVLAAAMRHMLRTQVHASYSEMVSITGLSTFAVEASMARLNGRRLLRVERRRVVAIMRDTDGSRVRLAWEGAE